METRLNPRSDNPQGPRILPGEVFRCHRRSRTRADPGQVDTIYQGKGAARRWITQKVKPVNQGKPLFGISGKDGDQLCTQYPLPFCSRAQKRRHVEHYPFGEGEMCPGRNDPSPLCIIGEGRLHGLNHFFHRKDVFQVLSRDDPHHPIPP